jgi:ATP-dependent RNA helicase RhlE
MTFKDFGLNDELLEAISYMGIEKPTPIQEMAIPHILEGTDLVASAQTGTGKTAAFILPILHKLITKESSGTNTLILVPTRELAIQIDQQIHAIAYFTSIESIAIYGGGDGVDWEKEKKALKDGTDIIVATPGKLKSFINMDFISFDKLEHLILDEADKMLDIGFYADIISIISNLPKKRQTLLFSATMSKTVEKLSKEILHKPKKVQTEVSKPAEGVLQATYLVFDNQKIPLIVNLIKDKLEYDSILIFTSTKKNVKEIVRSLNKTEKNVVGISSDLDQKEREDVLQRYKAKKIRVLVATDILSRGIDVKDISLIINYDVPLDAEDYVHRVGRTARANTTGVAITLINSDDMHRFHKIEKLIEQKVIRIPLPTEIGKGPEWKTNERSNYKRSNNSRKPNYRKKGNSRNYKGNKGKPKA